MISATIYDDGNIIWHSKAARLEFASALPGGFSKAEIVFAAHDAPTRLTAGQTLIVHDGRFICWWGWIEDINRIQSGKHSVVAATAIGPWQQLQQRLVSASYSDITSSEIIASLLSAYADAISVDHSQIANTGVGLTKSYSYATLASVVADVCAVGDDAHRPLLFAIWEPPGARVVLGYTGNMLSDPNFEQGATHWTAGGAGVTWSSSVYRSARYAWKFAEGVSNGVYTAGRVTVAASTTYVFEYYVYWTAYSGMSSNVRADWYDASDTLISTTYSSSLTSTGATGWQVHRATLSSPASAATARIHFQCVVGTGGGSARYMAIDDVAMYRETTSIDAESKPRARLWPRDLTSYDYLLRTSALERGLRYTTTTRDLANAVLASYGSGSYTAYAEDSASQMLYRRRDWLLNAGNVAAADAQAQRDTYLSVHAAPGVELSDFDVAEGAVLMPGGRTLNPARLRAGDRLRIVDGVLAGAVVLLTEVIWRDGVVTCRPETYEDVTRILMRVE